MTIRLPTNATASGECDESHNEPYITLGWNSKEGSCNFTMHFTKFRKDNQSERWAAGNLTFSLLTTVGSNGLLTFVVHSFSCSDKLVCELYSANLEVSLPKALVSTAEAVLSIKKLVKFKNQIFVIPICIHTVHSVKSCYSSVIIFINKIHGPKNI